jgi:hypothetical protein
VHGKRSVAELLGEELVSVRVRLREPDVVFVKSILEASEGLGAVFAEPRGTRSSHDGGAIVIAGPRSRAADLAELIADMKSELGGALWDDDPSPAAGVAGQGE